MRRLQRWLRKLGSCLLRQALAGFVLLLGAVVGWHARKSTGPAILSETLDQRVTSAGPRRPTPVTPGVQDPVSASLAAAFAALDSPSAALHRLKDAIARGSIGDHRALAESLLRHPLAHFRQEAFELLLPAWAEREPGGLLPFLARFRDDEIWLLLGDSAEKTTQLREHALGVWARQDAMAALRFAMAPANRQTFQDAFYALRATLFAQGNPMEQAWLVRKEFGESILLRLLSVTDLPKFVADVPLAELEALRDSSTSPDLRQNLTKWLVAKDSDGEPWEPESFRSYQNIYRSSTPQEWQAFIASLTSPWQREAAARAITSSFHPQYSSKEGAAAMQEKLEALGSDSAPAMVTWWRQMNGRWTPLVPEFFARQSPAFQEQWRLPVVAGLTKQQPALAAELWLQAGEHELAAPGAAVVAEEIAERYLRQDSEAASAWIGQLPPGSGRDRAVARMIERVAALDPETSAQWAATLADPDAQARAAAALQRAGSSTPLSQ